MSSYSQFESVNVPWEGSRVNYINGTGMDECRHGGNSTLNKTNINY